MCVVVNWWMQCLASFSSLYAEFLYTFGQAQYEAILLDVIPGETAQMFVFYTYNGASTACLLDR